MKAPKIEKSAILLFAIVLVLVGSAVMVIIFAGQREDDKLSVKSYLFSFEREGKPIETELLLFYSPEPSIRQATLLYIPQETAQIIKSGDSGDRGKYDTIDSVYDSSNLNAYKAEIEKLVGVPVNYTVQISLDSLESIVDLLSDPDFSSRQTKGGQGEFTLFDETSLFYFPGNPVEYISGDQVVLLDPRYPFDGAKIRTYVSYSLPGESSDDVTGRRREVMKRIYKAFSQRADYLLDPRVFSVLYDKLKTNMPGDNLKSLITGLRDMNIDSILTLKVTGKLMKVDGKSMLFPNIEYNAVKMRVQQAIESMKNAKPDQENRSIPIVIYNATRTKDLARKARDLFSDTSRYEVQYIDNWTSNSLEKTEVIDRLGNPEAAKEVAAVIGCKNIVYLDDQGDGSSGADDNTIVIKLGKDYQNGRVIE